jgi:hypothetical protein
MLMKQKMVPRLSTISIVILFISLVLPGCKKSSGSGSGAPTSGYPFSATVSGKAFNANFISPTAGGPGFAAIDNANGLSIMVAVGIQIVNTNDSSLFVVVFPTSITLNKPINLDPSLNTGAAYSTEASPGSSVYNSYGTNPANGGSGTLTVTEYDQVNKVVAGTFSGTFGSAPGGPTISVTNGKFRCIITTVSNPFPPNVKF